MSKIATIHVPSLKITVPLPADKLPIDIVPMDGPAGEPILDLVLEDGSAGGSILDLVVKDCPLTVRAKLNGKNYRKMIKQVLDHGAANVSVALQGTLRRSPGSRGGAFVLDSAGFQVNVKAERVAEIDEAVKKTGHATPLGRHMPTKQD